MALVNDGRYPGMVGFIEATYTVSHGITPGRVVMRCAPFLANLAEFGDAVLSDGAGTLTLRRCKLEQAEATAGSGGQEATIVLLDRRWEWQFCEPLYGRWNIPAERFRTVDLLPAPNDPNTGQPVPRPPIPPDEEPVREDTKKDARALARLCVEAMNEPDADVSAIDDTAFPTTEWDVTNPAKALQSLAEDFGCRVVFDPVTDAVSVQRVGVGNPLPDGAYLEDSPSLSAKPRPNRVRLYGARTRYQLLFVLEPVGVDFDGSVRHIDELSYKPENGWATSGGRPPIANIPNQGVLGALPGRRTYNDAVALAKSTVFRMYRITLDSATDDGELTIPPPKPGHEPEPRDIVKSIKQVRLLPFTNEATIDDTGRTSLARARCVGTHTALYASHSVAWNPIAAGAETDGEVKVNFTVDAERQLVIFDDHVLWYRDGGSYPAEIVLETACEYAEADTNQYRRYFNDKPIQNGGPSGVASLVREEVQFRVTADYSDAPDNGWTLDDVTDNAQQIEPRALYYMQAEALKYEVAPAQSRTYAGIVPVSPSGLVQQVTWAVGGIGPRTQASANGEHSIYLPTYGGRRQLEVSNLDATKRDNQEQFRIKQQLAEYDIAGGEF